MVPRVQVEQHVNQGPLQPRAGASVKNKSTARNFRRAREVENSELLTNLPVWLRLECELRLGPPAAHFRIVRRLFPNRDRRLWQIGNDQ